MLLQSRASTFTGRGLMTPLVLSVIALVIVSFTSALWFHRMRRVAIPANRGMFLAFWGLGLLIGAASLVSPGTQWASGILGALAVLGGAVMLALYALGRQRTGNPIEVGDAIPAFSAPDEHRRMFDSTSLAGTLTLIKFFRGHW
jgi:hypothetical protein